MQVCDLNPFLRFASQLLYEVSFDGRCVRVSDCRLFFVLEGSARLSIGENAYHLEPGSTFYCCAGSRYSIHTRESLRLIILNFDLTQQNNHRLLPIPPSRDPDQWDTMPVYTDRVSDSAFLNDHLFLGSAGNLQSSFQQIVEEFSSADRYSRELSSAGLKALLTALHRRLPDQIPPKIAQVQAYIQNNFASPITNRELADLVGYHEYYLNRIFTASVGQSLHGYLLQTRLSRAAFLILNTDMELQAIPEQVGFGGYPHFSAAFKQAYGFSPAQYRKRLRGSI